VTNYNIDEASRLSGISVRSLRNYVHHYGDYLYTKRGAYNSLVFSEQSLAILVKIKSLLRDGNNRHTICELLKQEEVKPAITVTRNSMPVTDNQAIVGILHKVDSTLTALLEENRLLRDRVSNMEIAMKQSQNLLTENTTNTSILQSNERSLECSRSRANTMEVPMPHSLLSLKDGCLAIMKSISTVIFPKKSKA